MFKCSTTFKVHSAQQFNRTPCNNSTNLPSCTGRQTSRLHSLKEKQTRAYVFLCLLTCVAN